MSDRPRHTVLRLTFETTGAWLVGDAGGVGDTDTVPLRGPDGAPEIPPASLAGSLRQHLRQQLSEEKAAELMGTPYQAAAETGDPSRLRVLSVTPVPGDTRPVETRTRSTTAVDRRTGSARRHTLRRTEHVVTEATYRVYLSCAGTLDDADRAAVRDWTPVVGRHRTNGWGRTKVTELAWGEVDLRDEAQLLRWLTLSGPALVDSFATHREQPNSTVDEDDIVQVPLVTAYGMHVGTGRTVADEPGSPASLVTAGETPIVPASTWRGVVRSRAEYILSSLDIHGDEVLARYFGSVKQRGKLTFHDAEVTDCVATETREHVAIDRITGGARDGLLFSEQVAHGRTVLRITGPKKELPDWLTALLDHVVRDIADGHVGVGGRTTRGLGTLRIAPGTTLPTPRPIDPSTVYSKEQG